MKNKFTIILFIIILLVTIGFISLPVNKNTTKVNSNTSKNLTKVNSNITKMIEIKDRHYNKHNLTLPYEDVSSYDSFENNVYMSVVDNSPSRLANKVVQYNRKTKKIETLYTSKFIYSSIQGVKSNQNWVTWVDSDDAGDRKNIYIMNTNTRKIELVTNQIDNSIQNEFPVLANDHLAWIYRDLKKEESYVMIRDLTTNQNTKIFILNTHTLENAFLSTQNGNILFTDKKGETSYCYVYNFSNKKMEEIQVPHKNIGWGELLNDHQIIYLAFFNEYFADNKLVLFDTQTKKAKEFSTNYMEVNRLTVDGNNRVFVGSGSKKYFDKYKIDNGSIKKIGEVKVKSLFNMSYNNGAFLMLSNPSDTNTTLIITNKLP